MSRSRFPIGTLLVLVLASRATAGDDEPAKPAVATTDDVAKLLDGWAAAQGTDIDATTGYPKRIKRSRDGAVMVLIPGGTFQMGAVPTDELALDWERPRHRVTLSKAYYLDEAEVTVAMWKSCAAGGGQELPKDLLSETTDACPIYLVSWEEARRYASWAGVTLPTEAQWERAAKGGHDDFVYPWGKDDDVKKRNAAGDDGFPGLAPVKSFPANDYGLFDMSGNIGEWCADRFDPDYYAGSPDRDPDGSESAPSRVLRGGSWQGANIRIRTSARAFKLQDTGDFHYGFRCAKSVPGGAAGNVTVVLRARALATKSAANTEEAKANVSAALDDLTAHGDPADKDSYVLVASEIARLKERLQAFDESGHEEAANREYRDIERAYIERWKNGRTLESIGQDLVQWAGRREGSRAVATFLSGSKDPKLLKLYKTTRDAGAAPLSATVTAFLSGWAAPEGTEKDSATGYPKRVRRTADGAVMVLIPAGTFQMGAVPGDEQAEPFEEPRHVVTLSKAYYLDETETTVGRWKQFALRGGGTMPSDLRPESTDEHPMDAVSWDEIQAYLKWAGVSLPMEAQWERAAKGGHDDFVYPWGVLDDVKRRNANDDDGIDTLAPVKRFAANDYGLFDMSGNVWEWCSDWFDAEYYAKSPPLDPLGPATGSSRIIRGGSWRNAPRDLRVSRRVVVGSPNALPVAGFRGAKTLP